MMTWFWIIILLTVIIGPFEAMYALNKARKNREKAEIQERKQDSQQ